VKNRQLSYIMNLQYEHRNTNLVHPPFRQMSTTALTSV